MKPVYIFSGLGADERAFKFVNFEGHPVIYITWLLPDKNENLQSYTHRISKQIIVANSIFIGLSFGGMVAIEVAKIVEPKQLILIASAKGRREIPFYYRLAGILHMHKLLPVAFLKKPSMITNWFFGISKQEDKQLLADILQDTDQRFLQWAIDKIVNWQNKALPANCTHIHGTWDRILPYHFVKTDIPIQGGGHFMTVNKAAVLTGILHELLKSHD